LSQEDSRILDEWRLFWHTELSTKIGVFDHYTAVFVKELARSGASFPRCLEIGPGITDASNLIGPTRVAVVELDPYFASELAKAFPSLHVIVGDIQREIPELAGGAYDRIVAFHVLEHLRDLPAALAQIKRTMAPGAVFDVVIPSEGGMAYKLGRRVTTARYFKKKFNREFARFIAHDHVNSAREILALLKQEFIVEREIHYPLRVPTVELSLCVGLRLRKPPID
jgi:SAM-dependent methyltransferase